jgi:Uma2 family endonuclease
MTLREFAAFDTNPDEKWELVEGVPFMSPSGSAPHNNLAFYLCQYLTRRLTVTDGWYVVQDTSVRFAHLQTEVRPDVAAYRRDEIQQRNSVPLRVVPRLAVECLSPGNADYDLGKKLETYRKAGVREYWAVDPNTGAISLFVLKKAAYEQLAVDAAGFIASPLLKTKLRIVVKPWEFEIIEG